MDTFFCNIIKGKLSSDQLSELSELQFNFKELYKNQVTYRAVNDGDIYSIMFVPEYRDNLNAVETIDSLANIEPEYLYVYKNDQLLMSA